MRTRIAIMAFILLASPFLIALEKSRFSSVEPDTVDVDLLGDVVNAHIAALGGRAALESRQSIVIGIEISDSGNTLRGQYRASRDGRMRIDIYDGESRIFTEAHNGISGWQLRQNAEAPSAMSSEGEAAVIRGIYSHLFGLHEYESLGIGLSYAGREVVRGVDYHRIQTSYPDGHVLYQYLNPETYLVEIIRDAETTHSNLDPLAVRFERRYSDFREWEGVVYSNQLTMVNIDTGEIRQTVVTVAREFNVPIEQSVFEAP